MTPARGIVLGFGLLATLTGAIPEVPPKARESVPVVRMIYLVPSDRVPQKGYRIAEERAIREIQAFYWSQLGGHTFALHDPVVEVVRTPHPVSWYQTNAPSSDDAGRYWGSVLADGFALTGGSFNDPSNRWIFYIDAEPLCGQYQGGTSGVALLSSNDFRGLICDGNYDDCTKGPVDLGGPCRWVGGLGHELGHAFNLPHPTPGSCPDPDPSCSQALMWTGYAAFPNAYLLPSDKQSLLTSAETIDFFSALALPPPGFACSDGCPPSRPSSLTGAARGNVIELAWAASAGAAQYAVWRGSSETDAPTLLASGLVSTSYNDSTAVFGQSYTYRVTASNEIGLSGNSSAVQVVVPLPPGRNLVRPGRGRVHPRLVDRP